MLVSCVQRTGCANKHALMADTRNGQRLPLNHPQRISARDRKLWRRDEARANMSGASRYNCPCPTCPGARPLLRDTILSHVRLLGRHHLRRGWTVVIFIVPLTFHALIHVLLCLLCLYHSMFIDNNIICGLV